MFPLSLACSNYLYMFAYFYFHTYFIDIKEPRNNRAPNTFLSFSLPSFPNTDKNKYTRKKKQAVSCVYHVIYTFISYEVLFYGNDEGLRTRKFTEIKNLNFLFTMVVIMIGFSSNSLKFK